MKYFKNPFRVSIFLLLAFVLACQTNFPTIAQKDVPNLFSTDTIEKPEFAKIEKPEIRSILTKANKLIETTTNYSQKYYSIKYPNGDVPKNTGACTDVVIRSYRAAGINLQKLVHEDMKANFAKYPKKWGLKRTDTNIDHRRVPNLRRFFERKEKSIEVTKVGSNYKPGDIVSWDLNGKGLTHIGVVSNIWDTKQKRYLIIHNIGSGTELEDVLFEWTITGHYRFF